MKCPNCLDDMLTIDRFNVEIDYCPTCRGVWLDRGELDKVIEFMETKKGRKKAREGSILPTIYPDDASGNYRHERLFTAQEEVIFEGAFQILKDRK